MIRSTSIKSKMFLCILILGLFIILRIVFSATGSELPLLRGILVCFLYIYLIEGIFFATTGSLLTGKESLNHSISNKKHIAVLAGLCLVTYIPAYSMIWFFHDDWLCFVGYEQNFFEFSICQSRPAMGLLTDLFSLVKVETSNYLGIFVVVCVIIYGLIWYQLFQKITHNSKLSILIAGLMMLITPIVNIVSYRSMFYFPLAFIYSMIGSISFIIGFKTSIIRERIRYFLIAVGGIVLACLLDKSSSTFVIPIILAFYLFEREKKQNKFLPICAIAYCVIGIGVYYLISKILAITLKTEIISQFNISNIKFAVKWLVDMLQQDFNQLVAMIRPNVFQQPLLVGGIQYKDITTSKIVLLIILAALIVGIYSNKKNRGILGIIQITILMILSYDPKVTDGKIIFLILLTIIIVGVYSSRESNGVLGLLQIVLMIIFEYSVCLVLVGIAYTSYYSVAVCSSFLLMIVAGCECVLAKVKANFYTVGWGLLILMILMNQNSYLENIGNYRYKKYATIKEGLQNNYNGENRIHIIGVLQQGGEADVYMISAVRLICLELGMNCETVKITTSYTENEIKAVADFDQVLRMLEDNDRAFLESIYVSDDGKIGILNKDLTNEEKDRLGKILKKVDLIPMNSEDTLIINVGNT